MTARSDFNGYYLFHKICPGVPLICGQCDVQRMCVAWCVCLKNKESININTIKSLKNGHLEHMRKSSLQKGGRNELGIMTPALLEVQHIHSKCFNQTDIK